jgi:hemolysin III
MLISTQAATREPSRRELAADLTVHVVGMVAAAVGVTTLLVLLVASGGAVELVAASIYGAGLIAMLGFSGAYNLARKSRYRDLLCRLDRSVIFLMIAGTYTPFTILGLSGAWEAGLLAFVWTVAVVGIVTTFVLPRRFGGLSVAVYLALGWACVAAAGPFIEAFDLSTLVLLAVGGVLYSVGTIFLVWRSLPYQHAIWHGFVVVAAAAHYGAVVDVMAIG